MAKAYILVEIAVEKTKEVLDKLKTVRGVETVNAVNGPYDIIATTESVNLNDIGDLVTTKIHPVPGIVRTVTFAALQSD